MWISVYSGCVWKRTCNEEDVPGEGTLRYVSCVWHNILLLVKDQTMRVCQCEKMRERNFLNDLSSCPVTEVYLWVTFGGLFISLSTL